MKYLTLRILSSRNVRNTDRPPFPSWNSSSTLNNRLGHFLQFHHFYFFSSFFNFRYTYMMTISVFSSPQRNNSSIKQIESIRKIAKKTVGNHFQNHFEGEECSEEVVTDIEDLRQPERL